ncbi:hypothetical protein SAMN05421779_102512 [Insolitispirillum peregrinum]|uniref:Uncharacterized protein n=1 Tax=Insolitispirillum peregrinum TaxID=80876 RepID=A0A1N7JXI6_9PROT|nr:hypothetical protein SAMN05421779_102512 [Insolitispirillum peregrinum]
MPTISADLSQSVAWGRFLRVFAGCALVLGLGVVAGLVALDPYGAGQPVSLGQKQATPTRPPKLNPRLAGAGRTLDPQFGGLIVGNSHSQLLDPARIGAQSGIPFASLSMPGTASREQLAVLDWIALRRGQDDRALSALVVVLDDWWCNAQGAYETGHAFPYWLYSADPLTYLEGLLRWESLEAAGSKLGLLLSGKAPASGRADGYMDYEQEMVNDRSAILARLQAPGDYHHLGDAPPPAAAALKATLARLNSSTAVALVMTPVYAPILPAPGSVEARRLDVCKAAFADLANSRPRTVWLDLMRETPETRDPGLFWDTSHYRSTFARQIENILAARLRLLHAESPHQDPPA